MQHLLSILLLIFVLAQCRPKEPDYIEQFPGVSEGPHCIKDEHDRLLRALEILVQPDDSTGRVAARTLELMQDHFREEERLILPPLEILPSLASELVPKNSAEIIRLSENFRSQLPHMNAEHQMIRVHLKELGLAAVYDNRPDVKMLEEEISRHARMEEEVYFPAVILIGMYLKEKDVQ